MSHATQDAHNSTATTIKDSHQLESFVVKNKTWHNWKDIYRFDELSISYGKFELGQSLNTLNIWTILVLKVNFCPETFETRVRDDETL